MEEIKKAAYVQPTFSKVVLTPNERIASAECDDDGTIFPPPGYELCEGGEKLMPAIESEPS